MDGGVDNYLHKKFKKQLSIDPKPQQYDKENKVRVVDTSEKKTKPVTDNIEIGVPNQSTNLPNSSIKSSISVDGCVVQPSNSCISYVVLNQNSQEPVNFDTKSSNFENHYGTKPENEEEEIKNEENQPSPDKSTGGKYVCTYCNLVCSKPSVLQKHIRAHTNERPYPCISCGFSFKTRSNLYKHCRSRTHANRVLGNKAQEGNQDSESRPNGEELSNSKPYKPRFHSGRQFLENDPEDEGSNNIHANSDILSHHINEIISKNNSIVNSGDPSMMKKRNSEDTTNNNEYLQRYTSRQEALYLAATAEHRMHVDEPLNLTKNRKRSMSEIAEPVVQKSLIKELLLKNLYSDMQCPYCKMIFQTVTELELHKLRSCKGKPSEVKYTRSSSVNVASILTKNKNAFDNIPQFQNTVFPLNSPGPFLGKTRLVDSDKSKSFSFDAGNLPLAGSSETSPNNYLLSPMPFDRDRKAPVKLFGGQVKVQSASGDTKSYRVDNVEETESKYYGKLCENRVVKSSLQSGGTVVTNNKSTKGDSRAQQEVIRVYENSTVSPKIDIVKPKFNFDEKSTNNQETIINISEENPVYKYSNIVDFSQKAVRLLTPNLKQPSFPISTPPKPKLLHQEASDNPMKLHDPEDHPRKFIFPPKNLQMPPVNPMNLLVNGKVVRYVPGMPGPVQTEEPLDMAFENNIVAVEKKEYQVPSKMDSLEVKTDLPPPRKTETKSPGESKSPLRERKSPHVVSTCENKKFARPNSLALKPTTACLKQHHGLTPTPFNQILISPDTPRVAKKYAQHFLHGNYFSYLGLKSSTKPVYCTLNKTQPFYVPHFKKLSMYSEWRQQDTRTDKMYVSAYDSRQRNRRYTTAGKSEADLVVHSSYKFIVSETSSPKSEKNDDQQRVLGGYECNDDYTYIRGRGRGRYVCDQCGIRCKKPSMLKKHIRTHSNDRPYTCSQCNFSFKTKGNLTKHMKSKAHTKNSAASSGSCSSTQFSGTQSSDSDTDDSGMDSSDESSTRQQEHEAAYGLLSLSQKTTQPSTNHDTTSTMTTEEIAYVSKTNYAKNKILDERNLLSNKFNFNTVTSIADEQSRSSENITNYLGKSSIRPLTYPYTSVFNEKEHVPPENVDEKPESEPKSIKQFHVIQKYAVPEKTFLPARVPTLKINDVVLQENQTERKRKIVVIENKYKPKMQKNDEVMDLSMPNTTEYNEDSYGKIEETNSRNENGISLQLSPTSTEEVEPSAMETLAEIATKQVKLEKNTLAKSVATEFLKLATKNDNYEREGGSFNKGVNELIVKPEGNKSCTICGKSFSKPSQLRLHMNIHYLERPFRCDSCSISFRTKGHLQKHERSASHHSKLSSSPAQSSSEPRPFKCSDCNIAFRIHGHLAKHLRSKMHIMKLECLAKIPFGLYAELERSNSLLTEINTSDGDQCLESLKALAKKVFLNDPNKLQTMINHVELRTHSDIDS